MDSDAKFNPLFEPAMPIKIYKKVLESNAFILGVVILYFIILIVMSFSITGVNHFGLLAESFLAGKTYFLSMPNSWMDTVPHDGQHYWPLGPFPAIVLVPFETLLNQFHLHVPQRVVHLPLVAGVFLLTRSIAKKHGYSRSDSTFLALAFCAASMFVGVSWLQLSWYFPHVIVVFLLFVAITESLGRNRSWIIGLTFGFIVMTRATAVIGIIYFILLAMAGHRKDPRKIIRELSFLLLPVFTAVVLLAGYNYLRFGDPIEQGYSNQILVMPELIRARSYGLFAIVHIPGNLYYSLLAVPLPIFRDQVSHVLTFPFLKADLWGMSLFLTSPYLFLLFTFQYTDRHSRFLWTAIVATAIPISLNYGIGYIQFGYRYALDFFPFLFFIFLLKYKEQHENLSTGLKSLIVLSAGINIWFVIFLLR